MVAKYRGLILLGAENGKQIKHHQATNPRIVAHLQLAGTCK